MARFSLATDLQRQPLYYTLYLPPCYDQEPGQRYPVLYLIHGQSFTDDQWLRLGLAEQMDALVASGEIPPFLVVLPYDPSSLMPDRDPFGQIVATELVPYIDAHYRTLSERTYRAIGGLSRGASWAVRLGLLHWETFGAIGAHSLPVFWTDGYMIPEWLDAIPPDQYPRIYLDIGVGDGLLRPASAFEQVLDQRGIPHAWHLFQGFHQEAYWSSHLRQYLEWYAAEW